MRRQSVDNAALERWRALDALLVLEKLGCLVKADNTFKPLSSQDTQRYNVNAEGRDCELLLTGPKFFDTRLKRCAGGAVALVMHLRHVVFKGATALLRRLAV